MSYIFFHDIGQFKIASMLSLYFLKSVMELQSWFLITNSYILIFYWINFYWIIFVIVIQNNLWNYFC